MKKGFALLETIIVITFLSVSLLLLYGTFESMIDNSKKNIAYDNASNIYKTYYLKEYLKINHLNELLAEDNIKEISCSNFETESCNKLIKSMNIHSIYITKYDLNDFNNSYSSMLNNYLSSLSNKENYKYRFVVEFNDNETYSYASLGFNGDENE